METRFSSSLRDFKAFGHYTPCVIKPASRLLSASEKQRLIRLASAFPHFKFVLMKFLQKTFPKRLDNTTISWYNKNIEKNKNEKEPLKMKKNDWYMEAIENTLSVQREEIDELKAAITYMEDSNDKSEAHLKMVAEYKQDLAEAIENLKSAEKYVESQKQYVA